MNDVRQWKFNEGYMIHMIFVFIIVSFLVFLVQIQAEYFDLRIATYLEGYVNRTQLEFVTNLAGEELERKLPFLNVSSSWQNSPSSVLQSSSPLVLASTLDSPLMIEGSIYLPISSVISIDFARKDILILINQILKATNWKKFGFAYCDLYVCERVKNNFEKYINNGFFGGNIEVSMNEKIVLDNSLDTNNFLNNGTRIIFIVGTANHSQHLIYNVLKTSSFIPQFIMILPDCNEFFSKSDYCDEHCVDLLRARLQGHICIDRARKTNKEWENSIWMPAVLEDQMANSIGTSFDKVEIPSPSVGYDDVVSSSSSDKSRNIGDNWLESNMDMNVPVFWDLYNWIGNTLSDNCAKYIFDNSDRLDPVEEEEAIQMGRVLDEEEGVPIDAVTTENLYHECYEYYFSKPNRFGKTLYAKEFDGMVLDNQSDSLRFAYNLYFLKSGTSGDGTTSVLGGRLLSLLTRNNASSIEAKEITQEEEYDGLVAELETSGSYATKTDDEAELLLNNWSFFAILSAPKPQILSPELKLIIWPGDKLEIPDDIVYIRLDWMTKLRLGLCISGLIIAILSFLFTKRTNAKIMKGIGLLSRRDMLLLSIISLVDFTATSWFTLVPFVLNDGHVSYSLCAIRGIYFSLFPVFYVTYVGLSVKNFHSIIMNCGLHKTRISSLKAKLIISISIGLLSCVIRTIGFLVNNMNYSIGEVHERSYSGDGLEMFKYCAFENLLEMTENFPQLALVISGILLTIVAFGGKQIYLLDDMLSQANAFLVKTKRKPHVKFAQLIFLVLISAASFLTILYATATFGESAQDHMQGFEVLVRFFVVGILVHSFIWNELVFATRIRMREQYRNKLAGEVLIPKDLFKSAPQTKTGNLVANGFYMQNQKIGNLFQELDSESVNSSDATATIGSSLPRVEVAESEHNDKICSSNNNNSYNHLSSSSPRNQPKVSGRRRLGESRPEINDSALSEECHKSNDPSIKQPSLSSSSIQQQEEQVPSKYHEIISSYDRKRQFQSESCQHSRFQIVGEQPQQDCYQQNQQQHHQVHHHQQQLSQHNPPAISTLEDHSQNINLVRLKPLSISNVRDYDDDDDIDSVIKNDNNMVKCGCGMKNCGEKWKLESSSRNSLGRNPPSLKSDLSSSRIPSTLSPLSIQNRNNRCDCDKCVESSLEESSLSDHSTEEEEEEEDTIEEEDTTTATESEGESLRYDHETNGIEDGTGTHEISDEEQQHIMRVFLLNFSVLNKFEQDEIVTDLARAIGSQRLSWVSQRQSLNAIDDEIAERLDKYEIAVKRMIRFASRKGGWRSLCCIPSRSAYVSPDTLRAMMNSSMTIAQHVENNSNSGKEGRRLC